MLTLPWNNRILPGFIVFEGLDGAGTTTQAHRLCDYFNGDGSGFAPGGAVFTCEPTDLPTGRTIRELIRSAEGVDPWTLALLFAADRNEHLNHPEHGIRANLSAGRRVISDRYLFSSLAYQGGYADFPEVERLNARFPLPEYLIFIDTPQETAEKRIQERKSRDSLERSEVQERAEHMYRQVITEFRRAVPAMQVHRFDGSDGVGVISDQIAEVFGR